MQIARKHDRVALSQETASPTGYAASFSTRVEPHVLGFNAAHFITYGDVCEPLHGHNFHVRVEARGDNVEDGYVLDFVALTRFAAEICAQLHDRVLLPAHNPKVSIHPQGELWRIECGTKQWSLPQGDCLILPIANTTAELIAHCIGNGLLERLRSANLIANVRQLEVAVEEADRQWGICTLEIPS